MYIFLKEMKDNNELINKVDMPKWQKKIIINYKKIFNKITIKKIDDLHYLYIVPRIKSLKDISKIIEKHNKSKIILSKELKEKYTRQIKVKKENEIEKNIKYFLNNILEYISNKINEELETQNLYILANQYNDLNLNIIKDLLNKVKTLTIVTDNLKNYKRLEDYLYKNEGTLITITNNKNKALRKAKIMINLDYSNDSINKYKINRNAIIINCVDEKIDIVYFQGIIVNNIEISFNKKEKYKELFKEFDKSDIYKSFEIMNLKYDYIIEKNKQNKVDIKYLLGNNGKINEKELENIQKYAKNI